MTIVAKQYFKNQAFTFMLPSNFVWTAGLWESAGNLEWLSKALYIIWIMDRDDLVSQSRYSDMAFLNQYVRK